MSKAVSRQSKPNKKKYKSFPARLPERCGILLNLIKNALDSRTHNQEGCISKTGIHCGCTTYGRITERALERLAKDEGIDV